MKILDTMARYLVGGLFIFSGLIKINDPVGTQIKLEEYFTVFAADGAAFFNSLKSAALTLSVLLSTAEVVLGLALLLRYKKKLTIILLLVQIVFFTFLTFYSAYFNKVTDCGCFGDAIKLTPWQSFTKDVILLVLIVILYLNRNVGEATKALKIRAFSVSGGLITCLIISLLAIAHLPFIDFRAYKVGTYIPGEMLPPEDDPAQVPKITNFVIWSDLADETNHILSGKKLLIVVHETKKTRVEAYTDIVNQLPLLEGKLDVVAVTASGREEFENLRHKVQLATPYFYSDKTLLKTMIRSNPGYVLLNNGRVIDKWHYNNLPDAHEILSGLKP